MVERYLADNSKKKAVVLKYNVHFALCVQREETKSCLSISMSALESKKEVGGLALV